jgi:hypothetical protein
MRFGLRAVAGAFLLNVLLTEEITPQPPTPRRAQRFTDRASAPGPPLIPGEPIGAVSGPPPRHDKVAERVLLIRDPAVIEDIRFGFDPANASQAALGAPTNSWGFPAIVRRARKLAGNTASDNIAFAWLTSQLPADMHPDNRAGDHLASSEWRSATLDGAPFRLLAIVNRPDLAKFKTCAVCPEGPVASGAEVRFAYGTINKAAGTPTKLAIIVEFVLENLTKAQFKSYVAEWMALGADAVADRPHALNTLLTNILDNKVAFARFRIIGQDKVSTQWPMREYSNENTTISLRPLSRQLPMREVCSPGLTTPQLAAWLNVPNHACAVLAQHYEFSAVAPTLLCAAESTGNAVGSELPTFKAAATGTPPNFNLGSNVTQVCSDRNRLQLLLSLNSCTRCHRKDTGAAFVHIGNRMRGARSVLSGFLCGVAPCPTAAATTYFTAPNGRKFNDLIRRHEYMLAIAGLDPAGSNWTTSLAGLINYEVH